MLGVSLRDLYELYPDSDVDVGAEQRALVEHDVIVFQHPLYWYSVPPLLKQWQDLVLEHGWAYGRGGTALSGKLATHMLSAGGGPESYREGGHNNYPLEQFLRPLEQTARLCHMRWLPPYCVHGTHRLTKPQLEVHISAYQRLLAALRDDRLDLTAAERSEGLHDDLEAVIQTPEVV